MAITASHALATERNLVKVEPDLPFELIAPLGCGLQTGAGTVLNTLRPRPGDPIALFGTGAVGSAAIMAAAAAGCTTILGIDLHEHRLELARDLGATHVVRGDVEDVAAQVGATTGRRVRFAIGTTGVNAVGPMPRSPRSRSAGCSPWWAWPHPISRSRRSCCPRPS